MTSTSECSYEWGDYHEEQVWNYEIGTKNRWWQQRITTNIALFYLDVKDQQLTQIIELSTGDNTSIIKNVGRTSIYGFESELGAALTENLQVDISYAWTRAEYRDHTSTDEADLNGSLAENNLLGDVSGNLVPRVPEHMASLAMRYELPVSGDRLWYISSDYTFESSRFAQEHNLIETGDRSLIGLRTGFNTRHWTTSLWVTNLFDDDTPVDIQRFLDRRSGSLPSCSTFPVANDCGGSSRSPRGFVITLPRGRQAGATVSYRF
ncbi:MAG: TonB-dependent receptor [Gammaproteobacteria bacterium]|nr:TonB-dependent receptor [Gammaproteobacteria bacterium]